MQAATFITGLLITIIGIILIAISLIKMMGKGKGESAGIVLIGPIPIVWGSSSRALILAVIMTIFALIIIALLWSFGIAGGQP